MMVDWIATGASWFYSTIVDTLFFRAEWLISLVLVLLVLVIITRDVQKWRVLALPVTVLVHLIGLQPSILWYMVVAILFAVEAASIPMVGATLKTAFVKANPFEDKMRKRRVFNEEYERLQRRRTRSRLHDSFLAYDDPEITKLIQRARGKK